MCYSDNTSRDSGMAISCVCRQVGLHRLVITMIGIFIPYLISVRLLGVLAGVTCVSRRCLSIVGEDFVIHIYVFMSCGGL